ARVVPDLLALPAGPADRVRPILALRLHEERLGLLVVPGVAVPEPLALLLREQPRLDPLPRSGLALVQFQAERLDDYRAVGELPAARAAVINLRIRARQRDPALLEGIVAPQGRDHRIRDQRWLHHVALDRREQARGAQGAREVGGLGVGGR